MNKLKKSNSPRPYLSWSQYYIWKSNPEQYKQIYIYGKEGFHNQAMRLGKTLAQRMETNINTDDTNLEQVAMFLPHSPKREYEINTTFKKLPLYGKLDGFNPRSKKKIIREIKTGTNWTQRKADTLEQLTFYSILVLSKYGKLPHKLYLDWVPTKRNEQGLLEIIGYVKTFETNRTMSDILLFFAKLKKAWSEIQTMTQTEYSIIN
jgi:hypothetical protein